MTCLPTSKDITIASVFIPPSGISPPNKQNVAPLDPVSATSGEGQRDNAVTTTLSRWVTAPSKTKSAVIAC
jgi:hypothetical protein